MTIHFTRPHRAAVAALGLALTVGGCATPSGSGRFSPGISAAAHCIDRAAVRLDDGVSPAHVIGRRALLACRPEIRAAAYEDADSAAQGDYVYRRLLASPIGANAVRRARAAGYNALASVSDMRAFFSTAR